jgi:hypothetical protein
MIKRLQLLALLLFFFISAHAQNPADTVTNLPAKDSITKPADTTAKRGMIDSATVRATADSLIKNKHADSAIVEKHQPADIVVKRSPIDGVTKHPVKNLPAKKTPKNPPGEIELKHSPIKSLSDKQYNLLLKGEDSNNMAAVGELNNYPLPDSALKYKVQLGLNPGQITQLKEIAADLHQKKLEMGGNIIRNEKMLDSLFRGHQVVDGTIIFYTNRYGLYLGEMRNAVLQACYKTEEILSVVQIKKLGSLEKVN